MKENLISISFTPEEKTTVSNALEAIEGVLKNKNMVNLSPEERQLYGRINNRTENWVNKVAHYMKERPELTPFYLDQEELEADMSARSFMENTLT